MTITNIMSRNPVLTYGMIGLLLWIVIWGGNIHYDDGGMRAAVYLLARAFLLPFLAVQNVLLAMNDGRLLLAHGATSVLVGLALCAFADVLYRRARAGRVSGLVQRTPQSRTYS